jgi:carbamoyl-phosphate synthase large subunit
VPKVGERGDHGGRGDVVDRIVAGDVDLVLNTPMGAGPRADGYEIRTAAVSHGVPCITTLSGILAAIQGIEALRAGDLGVRSLQDWHRRMPSRVPSDEDPTPEDQGSDRA